MTAYCVVDFDDTLLRTDSLRYLLRRERLYWRPKILWWGGWLFGLRFLLPRRFQLPIRRRLKYQLFKALEKRGAAAVIERHALALASLVNIPLARQLQQEYATIIVVTASWEPLVKRVLALAGLPFKAYGSSYTPRLAEFFSCWNVEKLQVVERLGIAQFDLYTDSLDDGPLARRATKVVMVPPNRPRWIGAPLKQRWLLAAIIGGALLVRLAGVNFGLPLWLVGDEPALIFGTLKMMELKTLLPSLHALDFGATFYYGPYLPYLYLLPFGLAVGARWLFFLGSFASFQTSLQADPSIFFVVARVISALVGTATVWLIYQASRQLLASERAALAAAAWLAFSFLPVNLSHWARHWIPVVAMFSVVIYILARSDWSPAKRYQRAFIVTGIAAGVGVQSLLILGWVGLWALIVERFSVRQLLSSAWWWRAIAYLAGLLILAFSIWPRSFGFVLSRPPVNAGTAARLIGEFPQAFIPHFLNLFTTEPILLLFFIVGSVVLWQRQRRVFIVMGLFGIGYLTLSYLMFGAVGRYSLLLYPLLAISAGAGLNWSYERLAKKSWPLAYLGCGLVAVAVLAPLVKLDYLFIKNDTRVQAIRWLEDNLPLDAKIAIVAPLSRLPTTPAALQEQARLDPASLRTVDRAEAGTSASVKPRRFVLNTYTIGQSDFFRTLPEYLRAERYSYLLLDAEFAKARGAPPLIALGTVIKSWSGSWASARRLDNQRIPDGFGDGLREIFYSPSLGPDLAVIKLN